MRKIKIGLLLVIFLIICSLATNVNAVTTINQNTTGQQLENALQNGGEIRFTYKDVVKNKYIFCRQQNTAFNRGIDYTYKTDSAISQVRYPDANNQGAEWAYLIAKNYNNQNISQANIFGDRTLQNIFWTAIGNSGNWTANTLLQVGIHNPYNNSLIAEATDYGNFVRGKHDDMELANTYRPVEIEEIKNAPKPRTYGPFVVNPNYWIYPSNNGTIKAGITDFIVTGIDSVGDSIYPHYTLVINNVSYGPFQGKITTSNYPDALKELNKNGKNGFKIILTEKMHNFQYEYSYKTIDATATFIPITSTSGVSTAQKLVVVNPKYEEKVRKVESPLYFVKVPEPNPQTAVVLELIKLNNAGEEINGADFTVIAKQDGENLRIITQAFDSGNHYLYRIEVGTDNNNVVKKDNIYINITESVAPTGYETINKNINIVLIYNSVTGKFDPTFQPGQPDRPSWNNHGFNANTFGGWVYDGVSDDSENWPNTYVSSDLDRIVVDNPETSKYEIKVYDKEAPVITLDLEKYAINDLEENYSDKTMLHNFQFHITAKQNNGRTLTTILDTDIIYANSQSINIIPLDRNRTPIDIEIEEIVPPPGFDKTNSIIKFQYVYNTQSRRFEPVFENATWHADGQLENTYVSNTNDKYQAIDNASENVYLQKILAYDTPAPIEFELKKFNSYFSEIKKPLNDAEFKITAYQENGNINDNVTIEASNGASTSQSISEGINVGSYKTIKVYPNIANGDNKIHVNIQETGVPDGYEGLTEQIKLIYTFENGKWNLEVDDSTWTLTVTDDDLFVEEDDITHSRIDYSFPNVYCVYDESGVHPAEITEQTMIDHNADITDIIRVEDDYANGGHIINVYNQREDSNIYIDLAKYGVKSPDTDAILLNSNKFRFSITAKQVGIPNSIVEDADFNTNLSYSFNVETGSEDDIYVVIKEENAPVIYDMLSKPINIKYSFNNITSKWEPSFTMSESELVSAGFLATDFGNWQNTEGHKYESSEGDIIIVGNDGTISVYNNEVPNININFVKRDINLNHLDGAIFNITILNIESLELDGEYCEPYSGNTYVIPERSIDGLQLKNVIFSSNDPIYIILQEVEAPEGYILLDDGEEIYIEIPLSGEPKIVDAPGTPRNEIDNDQIILTLFDDDDEPKELLVDIYNEHEQITLSGRVWVDSSTVENNKTYGRPDGIKNGTDEFVDGVEVQLYDRETNTQVLNSAYTDANGYYEFTVPDKPTGYYVKFIYDGISYETLNSRLRAYSGKLDVNDGRGGYEIIEDRNSYNDKFYCISKDSASNKASSESISLEYYTTSSIDRTSRLITRDTITDLVLEKYQMQAITDTYTKDTNNLNLALVKKETDIALTTSILTKNHLKIRDYLNSYTPSIYNSNLELNKPAVIVEGDNSYLIYRVDLINQSNEKVNVEEVAYHYDIDNSRLHFEDTRTAAINSTINMGDMEIQYFEGVYPYGVLDITLNDNKELLPHGTKTFYLVFKAATADLNDGLQVTNVVNLVKYSSDRSLIDKDSQPSDLLDEYSFEDDLFVANNLIKIN